MLTRKLSVTHLVAAVLAVILAAATSTAAAQAYCSLRDPVASINKLFPEADNFKSIVRVVDQSVRAQVSKELPPNTLHFGELGRHTLYVAVKNNVPLGFVHSRSEQSRWGLVEVAWALDLHLNIMDFHMQRCRSTFCDALEAVEFRRHFFEKSYADLKQMLAADRLSLNTAGIDLPAKAEPLASAILRCALKTALITGYVWGPEVAEAQMLARARTAFNAATSVELVPDFYATITAEDLAQKTSNTGVGIHFEQAQLARAYDRQGQLLGAVFHAPHTIEGQAYPVWWAIDKAAAITGVSSDNGWPSSQVGEVFDATIGRSFSTSQQCANRAELMALEATVAAMANLKP